MLFVYATKVSSQGKNAKESWHDINVQVFFGIQVR